FLHGEDLLVAIDPWLEGNPACPDHLKNPEKIDLIVVTHGHGDHASEAAKLAAKHGCPVVATFELANLLVEDGLPKEQAVTLNKGGGV
ncbi:MBL fold metallo-hydrolase, partial [Acinetobacter baumannii]